MLLAYLSILFNIIMFVEEFVVNSATGGIWTHDLSPTNPMS